MFFHVMVNGGRLKSKKDFDLEAKKRENLQAWFGESDAAKTMEEARSFLEAFHESIIRGRKEARGEFFDRVSRAPKSSRRRRRRRRQQQRRRRFIIVGWGEF